MRLDVVDVPKHEVECFLDFDESLKKIKGLRWLPWIGRQYASPSNRILVLGESHYLYGDYSVKDIDENQEETRQIVGDYVEKGHDAGNQYKMYEPIEQILEGAVLDSDANRATVWASVSYMNIIQHVLAEKTGNKKWQDFLDGWKVVLQVAFVLKPRMIISFSTDKQLNRVNFNRISEFEKEIGLSYSIYRNCDTDERIGNVVVATPGGISFKHLNDPIPVIFLQHASRLKRFDEWQDVLKRYTCYPRAFSRFWPDLDATRNSQRIKGIKI